MSRRRIRFLAVPIAAFALAGCAADDEDVVADEVDETTDAVDTEALDEEPDDGVIGEDEALAVDQTMVEEEEFFDNPEEFVGDQLTFTGDLGDMVGSDAFQLRIGDNDLLVLSADVPPDLTSGVALEVTGVIELLEQDVVDEAGLEWSDELQAFEGQVAMLADTVDVVVDVPDEDAELEED